MNTIVKDRYISKLKSSDQLTSECEIELASRLRDSKDRLAEERLIKSQLKLVVTIARRYSGYGLPEEDLIQEGNIGLTKAVRRFDPDRGIRLSTYAGHAINSEILEYIIRNWRIVRVATTKEQRKLFFNIRKHKPGLDSLKENELIKIAKDLSVKPEIVREMERRMAGGDASFDAPGDGTTDARELTPSETMYSIDSDPSKKFERSESKREYIEMLEESIRTLDPRSRDILNARWLQTGTKSVRDVIEKYSLTPAKMKQIERAAFRKLRIELYDTNAV